MRVAITGSTGLIGTALRAQLAGAGHVPVQVVRGEQPAAGEIAWKPADGRIDAAGFEGVDAVVNLSGAGIGDKRWSEERKQLILQSRTTSTRLLANTLAALDDPPRVFLSGSAIGFYGDRGDEVLTEASPPGDDFLADVCKQWEAAAQPAVDAGIRTCFLRTGIVQSTEGGALGKTLPLFKFGLGGRLGTGDQWWSWISIDDEVRAILHLLTSDLDGPVDLTAPNPVTNSTYTEALGDALGRPTILPIPKFGPQLLLGRELADALLFTSARVHPSRLESDGFVFRHPTIEGCLRTLVSDDREVA